MEVSGGLPALGGRRAAAVLGVLAALGLAAGYAAALRGRPRPVRIPLASPAPPATQGPGAGVWVHVAGAVARPGLYRLAPGARVDDAVRAAGGPVAGADLDALNLAARLRDGDKVVVPRAGTEAPGGAAGGGGPPAPSPRARINLNTATEAELDTLPGIGPALARRIVAYRQQHGGFRSVRELQKVPGIGPRKFAEIEPLVTV